MDSRRGRQLYRFDMSLMERLATSGLSMSQIDVQRRMRPAISNLIRSVQRRSDVTLLMFIPTGILFIQNLSITI